MLFLSFLSCPVSSGLLYFSWEFFSLYLFILDSLVSISSLRPLPGRGPPQDNGVYSSRPRTAGTAAVKNLPPHPHHPPHSPLSTLHPPVGRELVAWENWARFVRVGIFLMMRARTGYCFACSFQWNKGVLGLTSQIKTADYREA